MKSSIKVVLYVYERGTISYGRYAKGVLFLSKMVHKRVRVCTSGRILPVENFIEYPPPPGVDAGAK